MLLESEVAADPLEQFRRWVTEAEEGGVRVPEAVALATASAAGRPAARRVLRKGGGERGIAFFSGYESRKGRELAANPRAALLFHWDPLGRQVRVEGPVERTTAEESDLYFATRPAGARAAAWASRQSEPIGSREQLDEAARAVTESGRPPHWGGYRLRPETYEFWQHRDDRLHDRLRYEPAGDGWRIVRLAP